MFNIWIHAARKKRGYVAIYVFLLVMANGMLVGYPIFLNRMLIKHSSELAFGWCVYSVLIPIILCLKDYFLNVTCNLLANEIVADLITKMTKKEELSVQFYPSDQINRTLHSYAFLLCSYYLYCGLDMLVSVLSIITMLGILWRTQTFVAILVALIQGVRLLLIVNLSTSLECKNKESVDSRNAFLGCFVNYMQKLKDIMVRKKGIEATAQLSKQAKSYLFLQHAYARIEAGMQLMDMSGIYLSQLLVIGAAMFFSNIFPLSFTSLQLAFSYSESIGQEISGINQFSKMRAMARSYHQVVLKYTSLSELEDKGKVAPFHELIIEDVSFSYDKRKEILHHINMTIEKGKINVISGENGQGKSTLGKILAGLYPTSAGHLLLDGKQLTNDCRSNYLCQQICYLAQESPLFEGTILDNLFSNDTELIDTVTQNLHLSELDRFVHWRDTVLSGGEKRKILLARFFLEVAQKKPSLIILDEPTYALDSKTAKWVWEQIAILSVCTLTIVISHDSIPSEHFITHNIG